MELDHIFETADPIGELAVRGGQIRKDLMRILAEQKLPQIIADTRRPAVTPGGIHTNHHTEWKGSWDFSRLDPNSEDPALRGKLGIDIDVTTNRPVNSIQAFEAMRGNVADTIADALMGALKFKLHGIKSTKGSTDSTMKDGQVIDYSVQDKGEGNRTN